MMIYFNSTYHKMIPKGVFWTMGVFIFSFIFVSKANACGGCVQAKVDFILPDAYLSSQIIVVWFIALSLIAALFKVKIDGFPSILAAIGIVVLGGFVGTVIFGWIVFNGLAAFCILGSFEVFKNRKKSLKTRWLNRVYTTANIFSCALLALFLIHSIKLHNELSEVDHILRWEFTGAASTKFNQMLDKGSQHLPDFKKVAKEGQSDLLVTAAKGIEKYGDPKADVPLLINAMFTCQEIEHCGVQKIKDSLTTLSGFDWQDIRKDSTSLEWLRMWEERKKR